jgi:hypothetical protein
MSKPAAAGRIETQDVDLLVKVVRPFDVVMRQMQRVLDKFRLHQALLEDVQRCNAIEG